MELAVVDNGVGLLANARKVRPDLATHVDAIHWAFQRGTTSAPAVDDMAQRLPEDAPMNPFPEHVLTTTSDNHHAGEGLWQLLQLVGRLQGSMWVMSGDTDLLVTPRDFPVRYRQLATVWTGLAIEVSLPVGT